ncbi:hypothetical protein DB32_000560 [Sandaracinus amylolyticus]|uniref:Uncharacterized protein n=1 Tax=Sandaracinus amylolyticus TaxID=927083 RepID=A0A0F6VZ93_9BACT|nr:hypothetical protein DB32_000560 [Sandaracinus amylolyticus]
MRRAERNPRLRFEAEGTDSPREQRRGQGFDARRVELRFLEEQMRERDRQCDRLARRSAVLGVISCSDERSERPVMVCELDFLPCGSDNSLDPLPCCCRDIHRCL